MDTDTLTDKQLVERVRAGNADWYGELVERYIGSATAVARARLGNAAEAEDAVQEAFVRAYERLHTLRDPAKFGAWVLTIARHEAVRLAAARAKTGEFAEDADGISNGPDIEQREMNSLLRGHLMKLPEMSREVLLLHYFAGKSAREIAELLEIRRGAVLKRLERARGQLAESMLRDLEAARPTEESLAKQVAKILAVTGAAAIPSAVATSTVVAGGGILSASALTKIFGVAAGMAIAGTVFLAANPRGKVESDLAATAASTGIESNSNDGQRTDVSDANAPVVLAQQRPSATGQDRRGSGADSEASATSRSDLETEVTGSATVGGEELTQALKKNHALTVTNEHVSQVLKRLSERTGVQFLIDTQAVGVPVYNPTQVLPMEPYLTDGRLEEVTVEDMPITEVLQRVARELGLEAVMEPNYVWISTRENIAREVRAKPPNNRFDAILQTPISTAIQNKHLIEVVEMIAGAHNLNIAVDQRVVAGQGRLPVKRRLPGGKVTEGTIAYIDLNGVPLADAADLMARLLNVTMLVQPEYVWLSSRDQIREDGLGEVTGEAAERINRTMKNAVSLTFEDIDFTDIGAFASQVYRVAMVLDQRVVYWPTEPTSALPLDGGVRRDTLSHGMIRNFRVDSMKLETILNVVLRQLGLGYSIQSNKLVITNDRGLASLPIPAERLVPPGAFPVVVPPAQPSEQADSSQPAATPTSADLQLFYIQPAFDNSFRASIRCGGVTKLYAVGEAFMEFKVLSIDAESKCVTLLDEKTSEEIRLCL